jgi:hypothetical protein
MQIITGVERRRRWPRELKLQISPNPFSLAARSPKSPGDTT